MTNGEGAEARAATRGCRESAAWRLMNGDEPAEGEPDQHFHDQPGGGETVAQAW